MIPEKQKRLNNKHGYKMSPETNSKMQKDIEKEYKDGGEENKENK